MRKFTLEGKEYQLEVNGKFMKDYQTKFGGNLIVDIHEATSKLDMLKMAQLFYIGANIEVSFDEWLKSFGDPFFMLPLMADLTIFFLNSIKPTVLGEMSKTVKKKNNL